MKATLVLCEVWAASSAYYLDEHQSSLSCKLQIANSKLLLCVSGQN